MCFTLKWWKQLFLDTDTFFPNFFPLRTLKVGPKHFVVSVSDAKLLLLWREKTIFFVHKLVFFYLYDKKPVPGAYVSLVYCLSKSHFEKAVFTVISEGSCFMLRSTAHSPDRFIPSRRGVTRAMSESLTKSFSLGPRWVRGSGGCRGFRGSGGWGGFRQGVKGQNSVSWSNKLIILA